MNNEIFQTFKKGSKTYFYSSLFFPKHIRIKVFILYAFVRTFDNFVDAIPQEEKEYFAFKELYLKAKKDGIAEDTPPIIAHFVELEKEQNFPREWVDDFFNSMELDLHKKEYNTLDETINYCRGSAEAIGLFMSSILGLSEKAYPAAIMLGRAMQHINFIRDIAEDITLGRRYIPLEGSSLPSLEKEVVEQHRDAFIELMKTQREHYLKWQQEGEKGYKYIRKRFLIPIKSAADMYLWTAKQIEKDPFIVYRKKVKPSKLRIVWTVIKNMILL